MPVIRRDALKIVGAALAAGLSVGAAQAEEKTAPPKGPKIGPPPSTDENAAEEELGASDMIGMTLRVVKPGQAVTQDYNDGRLTITVDKNNVITEIRVG